MGYIVYADDLLEYEGESVEEAYEVYKKLCINHEVVELCVGDREEWTVIKDYMPDELRESLKKEGLDSPN